MKTGLKRQFWKAALVWIGLFLLVVFAAGFFLEKKAEKAETEEGDRLVLLNEIEQLTMDEAGKNPAKEELESLKAVLQMESAEEQAKLLKRTGSFYALCTFLFMAAGLFYVYFKILRSVMRMKLPKGISTFPLNMSGRIFSARLRGLLTICGRKF